MLSTPPPHSAWWHARYRHLELIHLEASGDQVTWLVIETLDFSIASLAGQREINSTVYVQDVSIIFLIKLKFVSKFYS